MCNVYVKEPVLAEDHMASTGCGCEEPVIHRSCSEEPVMVEAADSTDGGEVTPPFGLPNSAETF